MKKFKCKICGYVIEAENLPNDFACPMCEVSRELFEEIEEKKEEKKLEKRIELIEDKNDKCIRVSKNNPSITKVVENCINCGLCKKVCKEKVGVNYEDDEVKVPVCINCGQCVANCPKDALRPKQTYRYVRELISKNENIMVVSTAPAVRVSLAEEFGYEIGTFAEGKMITALRKLGFDYVLDVTFGADLTIMEEAQEFVNRIKNGGRLPQFTSCCPAWVKYAEIYYPELLPYISTCKSPISMQGSIIKTYFCEKMDINPKKIVNVVVVPCTAKKYEINRKEFESASDYWEVSGIRDNDYVITTTELVKMIQEAGIDFSNLEDGKYDSILGKGSGAGVIFGNTGGVMEAALRTAYHILTGEVPPKKLLDFKAVRGLDGVKEATVMINKMKIKVAVVQGLTNIASIVEKMNHNELDYRFIEVMNCVGGCIGGGGQPIHKGINKDEIRLKRIAGLYHDDKNLSIRCSFENKDIKRVYQDFLKYPGSRLSEKLLHTRYTTKKHIFYK
ncbi:MAG: [FeFe] hydrogenase, group A [Clostridia bacterium]|nr:[FeFe] hydrogenase, group A [Clostridia bacterium]